MPRPHDPKTLEAPITATELGVNKHCQCLFSTGPLLFKLSKVSLKFYTVFHESSTSARISLSQFCNQNIKGKLTVIFPCLDSQVSL